MSTQKTGKQKAQTNLLSTLNRWMEARPYLTLALLTLIALGPFIAKPFNIDDPLFIWAGKHIQSHPANPYDFTVNWYTGNQPMWTVTKNPPLACYYLALAASVLGWNEVGIHFAFLIPAVLAIIGTFQLARLICARPLFAAAATLFMPVFLVSATSVMCDVTMLAFWIWAVVFWVEGMAKNDFKRLLASAVLMTLAAYAKYFGICLIPLLFAYSLIKEKRIGLWMLCFLVPILGLIGYQWITFRLYGRGLLGDAGEYATNNHGFTAAKIVNNFLAGLTFTGGCAAVATLLTPWLWRGRIFVCLTLGTVVFCGALLASGQWWIQYDQLPVRTHGWVAFQVLFWAVGGVSVLALAVSNLWRARDADAWLLALWIFGTFLFCALVNWTVNGRSILPMAPAIAVLLARRLDMKSGASKKAKSAPVKQRSMLPVRIGFAVAVILGVMVARADYGFAQTARKSAETTYAKYGQGPGSLWFMGHWGWQYYLEQFGVKALATDQSVVRNGDFIAVPYENSNMERPNPNLAQVVGKFDIDCPQLFITSNVRLGGGFYASLFGPLPFAIGTDAPQRTFIFVVGRP